MRKMELKVFGGWTLIDGKQVAAVVAASSQRNAVAALAEYGIGLTVRELVAYWPITGNRKQCEVALAVPGTVYAASSLDTDDYKPLPRRPLPKTAAKREPKVPTDPQGRKLYDKERREVSNATKIERGELRINSWIPADAAAALDQMTGGSRERGAVREALALALKTYVAHQGA
jgi:hypothetical protein